MKVSDIVARLKLIRDETGYSLFDQAVKQINRERLGVQTEKRKPLSNGQRLKLYAKQDGICHRCGYGFKFNEMTDDHRIPISRGGTNDFWNRRLVCKSCNSSKGDNMPIQESKITGQTILEQLGND